MAANVPTDVALTKCLPGGVIEDLAGLRKNWAWLLAFGVASILVGTMAIGSSVVATEAVVWVFGIFMLAGGAVDIAGSFWARGWGGFFLHLLVGILYLAAGFILVEHPLEAAVVYTLMLAVFFFAQGLFRMIGAIAWRFHNWGWVFFSGLITAALGVLIWRQWPVSGLWVIGLFVGIDLIFSGWGMVMLALASKNLRSA